MRKEILLDEGKITSKAIDKVTGNRVKVLNADIERKIVIIKDEENDIEEFRFFSEIQCIQIVEAH